MKKGIIFILLICVVEGFAQPTWLKRLSWQCQSFYQTNDTIIKPHRFSRAPDGNIYVDSDRDRDVTGIYKITPDGEIEWYDPVASNSGNFGTFIRGLEATPDSGCIFGFMNYSWIPYETATVKKYSKNMNVEWIYEIYDVNPYTEAHEIYDITVLPGSSYAILTNDSILILDPNGNFVSGFDYYSLQGSLKSFPNGDLFIKSSGFQGRVDINGNVIWNILTGNIFIRDSFCYRVTADSLFKLDPLTGIPYSAIPYVCANPGTFYIMSDGGWAYYLGNSIFRFDSNGIFKWTFDLNLSGIPAIIEMDNGTLLTGGSYRCQQKFTSTVDYGTFIATIDSNGRSVMDSTDNVWPGDVSSDYITFSENLFVALAQGVTGPPRDSRTYTFFGEQTDLATRFSTSFGNGINHYLADVDGSGIVDTNDFFLNNVMTLGAIPLSGIAPFQIAFSTDTIYPGDTIRINFIAGNNLHSIDSVFGIALDFSLFGISHYLFDFTFDPQLYDSDFGADIDLHSRSGNATPQDCQIFAARKDLQNVYNLYDTIGFIDFIIPYTITQNIILTTIPHEFKAITKDGFEVGVNLTTDSTFIFGNTVGLNEDINGEKTISISYDNSDIVINDSQNNFKNISVFNLIGNKVFETRSAQSLLKIDVTQFTRGVYLVRIITDKNIKTAKVYVD